VCGWWKLLKQMKNLYQRQRCAPELISDCIWL
jgi:hypothetical protein